MVIFLTLVSLPRAPCPPLMKKAVPTLRFWARPSPRPQFPVLQELAMEDPRPPRTEDQSSERDLPIAAFIHPPFKSITIAVQKGF